MCTRVGSNCDSDVTVSAFAFTDATRLGSAPLQLDCLASWPIIYSLAIHSTFAARLSSSLDGECVYVFSVCPARRGAPRVRLDEHLSGLASSLILHQIVFTASYCARLELSGRCCSAILIRDERLAGHLHFQPATTSKLQTATGRDALREVEVAAS